MAETVALNGRASLHYLTKTAAAARICTGVFYRVHGAYYATGASASLKVEEEVVEQSSRGSNKKGGKWMKLPPFNSSTDNAAASVAKEFSRVHRLNKAEISSSSTTTTTTTNMTALKWILRCCPQLPRCLVQKLFRLRQVRRESVNSDYSVSASDLGSQAQECRLRRVSAKDAMNSGDRILFPVNVQDLRNEKQESKCSDLRSEKQEYKGNDDELTYMHSLELYKDPSIIVVNKPPGMPVQGGIGIKKSLDVLASNYLRFDYLEPPRLVHRLDRDSSGVLVMGRTQTSTTILHSIFREKTFGASSNDTNDTKRLLQRKYWALVIGTPRHASGLISAPLGKVVMDNGKSERITVVNHTQNMSSQHAITEYRLIQSPIQGLTWIELCPLTGRKHQLRVHCAEVLGTPIVGDYKYGWQAHKRWKPVPWSMSKGKTEKLPSWKMLPFILDLESGSISEKEPHLHLHCRQMILPDVHLALQHVHSDSDLDLSELESLDFVAPLPSHMQRSWDILNS